MAKIIKALAAVVVICGIIAGIYYANQEDPLAKVLRIPDDYFKWSVALIYWISSIISGFLLYAFALLLETVEQNNHFLREVLNRIPASERSSASLGNSKASLDKLKDYKMQ